MTDNLILDEEQKRRWYTQIPNVVFQMGLTPYAFILYAYLKKVAGDDGACWQSERALAKGCGVSTHVIVKCKRELAKAGLIRIELVPREYARPYHNITIVNIWTENEKAFWLQKVTNETPNAAQHGDDFMLNLDQRLHKAVTL